MIEREKKRERLIQKYAEKRASLKEAFHNAITTVLSLGGSTNAVLHLLAIAYEAKVDLTIDVFDELAREVPHLAGMKPFGKYHMVDLD